MATVFNNTISVPPLDDFVTFYNGYKISTEGATDIYHYTSSSAIISILEHSELRFTDRNFMNDKSEGTYTKNLALSMLEKNEVDVDPKFSKAVRDKLKEKQGNGLETYSCSFSLNKDSLCLWNYYSKDASSKGYNIHFHIDDIQDFIEAFRKDKHVKVLGSKNNIF